jgi:nitrogen regulatory protein P-II 1
MKHLILIVHTNVQQDLTDQLRKIKEVSGFTYSAVEGHGVHLESDSFLAARDEAVGYTARVRVDIMLEDSDVDIVLDTIRNATYDIKGHAAYWVTDVEKSGRF